MSPHSVGLDRTYQRKNPHYEIKTIREVTEKNWVAKETGLEHSRS